MSLPAPTPDTTVLVTGTSSGIGADLARELAGRGYNLALAARRRELLEELADELRTAYGVEVTVHPCDLGDATARQALIDELLGGPKAVVGVGNCAGFGTSGRFHELPRSRELQEVDVNVSAIVDLTHAFVGPMVERGAGAILNIASVAAFQPLPRLATYSATKAFVQTFSEAVHEELRGTGVSCTVVCPGPVATPWAEIADAQAVMIPGTVMSSRDVAREALDGFVKGRRTVLPGFARVMSPVGRFTPRTILLPGLRLMQKALGSAG